MRCRAVWEYVRRLAGPATEEVSPEVALIMQELDAELEREFELLEDGVGRGRDIGALLRSFAQRCHRVALVGSRRRGNPAANDIDVLYVPKSGLQVVEFLEQIADDEAAIRHEAPRWTCTIASQQVDFIESASQSWGADMVHYTGDRAFNERVLRHASRRGYRIEHDRPVKVREHAYGRYTIPAFDGWTEDRILGHLGLATYANPRTRSIGLLR